MVLCEVRAETGPSLDGATYSPHMVAISVFTGAGLLVALLVVTAGHRMLTRPGSRGGGTADALGNFIDVFDPARAQADRDLQSRKSMGEVLPSPDDDDRPEWSVDLQRSRVRIRRPR